MEYLSIGGYVDIKKEIQKWIGDATWQIVIKTYTPQEVSDILNGVTTSKTISISFKCTDSVRKNIDVSLKKDSATST